LFFLRLLDGFRAILLAFLFGGQLAGCLESLFLTLKLGLIDVVAHS
jgi:hypothetical protein